MGFDQSFILTRAGDQIEEDANVKVEVLTPIKKVEKMIWDPGLSNLEYIRNVIEKKGKTTVGRLNGTIKLNSLVTMMMKVN